MEARFLYQRFLEKYFPDFLIKKKDILIVYDWKQKCFLETLEPSKHRKNEIQDNKLTDNNLKVENPTEAKNVNILQDEIQSTLETFYRFIGLRLYTPSYFSLDLNLQYEFQSSSHFFCGYYFTTKINSFHIFDVTGNQSQAFCKVYLEENIMPSKISVFFKQVLFLGAKSDVDIDLFIDMILGWRRKGKVINDKRIRDTGLKKIDISNKWVDMTEKGNRKKPDTLLKMQFDCTILHSLYSMHFSKVGNHWLIKEIIPLNELVDMSKFDFEDK